MKVNPNLTPNITKSWAPPFFQTYTHSQTPFRTMKFLKGAIQVIAPTPLAQSWHPLRINSICHCQAIPVPCFFFVSRTWDKLDSCHPQLASTVGFIQIGVSNEQVPVQVRAVEKKILRGWIWRRNFKNLYFLHRNLGFFWRYEIGQAVFSGKLTAGAKGLLAFLDHFRVALDANLQRNW